jgi:hypothetical protein
LPEQNPGLSIVGCGLIQGRSATERPTLLCQNRRERKPKDLTLEPHHLMAISMAFDDVCKALKLAGNHNKAGR